LQTIIGNNKLLHILKKHSLSHSRSGKQTITTKTIYSLLLFTLFSNYLDTLEMFPMTQYSSVPPLSTSYGNMRCHVETTFCNIICSCAYRVTLQ